MNNLLSYCGLVDSRISASDKDLPVQGSYRLYHGIYVNKCERIVWNCGSTQKGPPKFEVALKFFYSQGFTRFLKTFFKLTATPESIVKL